VKRAALGEVLALDGSTLYHDCSTLGGNSGSPVFALDDATVAAIHFSGFFMYRNSAITAAEIAAFVTTH
jgi:endonuclease G